MLRSFSGSLVGRPAGPCPVEVLVEAVGAGAGTGEAGAAREKAIREAEDKLLALAGADLARTRATACRDRLRGPAASTPAAAGRTRCRRRPAAR